MDKFIRKYLKLAKTLAEDNDACFSRKIAVVLVDKHNGIVAAGYNGTLTGVPHPDTKEYLTHLYNDLLTKDHKKFIKEKHQCSTCEEFLSKFVNKKQCPRRILEIPSGRELELCPCAHAERNALAIANRSGICTVDTTMFCYCTVPCDDCTKQIIHAKVRKVVCLKSQSQDYSVSSRWLFQRTGVVLEEYDEKDLS